MPWLTMTLRSLVAVLTILHGFLSYSSGMRIGVAGLFQIKQSNNDDCDDTKTHVPSVMAVEAVKWTLRNLHEGGDAPDIELIPYKTCGLSTRTTEAAIDIISDVARDSEIHLAGIIGPEFSTESMIMSDIITSLSESQHLVQISYSATASILDDKTRFTNFFRVIPNDDEQVETMVELMLQLNWNRVGIVHDDDLYALEIVKELVILAEAKGICIPSKYELPTVGADSNQYQSVLNDMLINRSPAITGLVFVGRQQIGKRFIQFASTAVFVKNTPAMILCESFQLHRAGLADNNGQTYQASKGSYIVTPEYEEITEFTTYWKNLFKNQSLLLAENATNPWLLDIYEEQFGGCRPDGTNNCPQLTNTQIDEQFTEQPLYVRYAIIATYTMADVVRSVVEEKCGGQRLPCQQFYDTSGSKDVLDKMNGLEISYGDDFNFTVAGLQDKRISFGASKKGELYQVYNFQETTTDGFSFVPIGEYNGTMLTMSKAEIKDYYDSSDGFKEHDWPSVRKAQCQAGKTCLECIPDDSHDDFVFLEGEVYIVALVPYRESDSQFGCGKPSESNLNGFGNSVAILKAVKDFNAMNQFGRLKVGVIVFDSCSNPTLADWRIKNILKSGLKLNNGTVINIKDKILGVLASYFSSVSVAISQTLTSLRIPHLAYGATSPALSNRTIYPYFVRVTTPDSKQAEATVSVLKRMDYTYIQLIYSEDSYGEGFRDSFLSLAELEGICVVSTIGIDAGSSSNINKVYQILRKKPYAKMVVLMLSIFVNELLETVTGAMKTGEFSFLGSESWGINLEPLGKPNSNKLLGSITINLEIPDQYGLKDEMKDVKIDADVSNPWRERFLQSTMQCHYETSFDKTFTNNCTQSFRQFWEINDLKVINWGPLSYLGAQVLLNGTTAFHAAQCRDAATICDGYSDNLPEMITNMIGTSTISLHGKRAKVFDANGDGNTGYVIYNIQKKRSNPLELEYMEIFVDGSFDLNKGLKVDPTSGPFLSTCPNEKTCSECRPITPTSDTKSSPQITNIALGSVVGVLVLIIIILIVVLCVMRRKINKLNNRGDGYLTPADVTSRVPASNYYHEHFDHVHVPDMPDKESDDQF